LYSAVKVRRDDLASRSSPDWDLPDILSCISSSRPSRLTQTAWASHLRLPERDPSPSIRAQDGVDTEPANGVGPASQDSGTGASPYGRLRRWAHILGFGGHFLTKGRHYSTTFAVLRAARASYQRGLVHDLDHEHPGTGPVGAAPLGDTDDEDTVLLVGSLSYAGTGWRTSGDALLAATAADLARSRHLVAREELAHELGTEHLSRTTQQAA
jgi:hypothetical protein